MTNLHYYEAPYGKDLAGLVDPVDLPRAFRVIARPNAKSIHSMAGDMMRTFGATRDLYSRAQGSVTLLNMAAAWGLSMGVTDVYIGEAQDMAEGSILDTLEFSQRIGANLHLVYSFGETATHAETITRFGGTSRPFTDLPDPILLPEQHPAPPSVEATPVPFNSAEVLEDEWMTFRATYLHMLGDDAVHADAIYFDAYTRTRESQPSDKDAIAALISHLWAQHGLGEFERTIVIRAMQAASFRNGLLVKVDAGNLERWVKQHLLNPLNRHHYQALRSFADPWRAAATVLHAHHIPVEDMLATKALDVDLDGNIARLDLTLPSEAGTVVAAQRWRQLLVGDADSALFDKSATAVRTGIRRVVAELDLPLITSWRRQSGDRWTQRHGLTIGDFR